MFFLNRKMILFRCRVPTIRFLSGCGPLAWSIPELLGLLQAISLEREQSYIWLTTGRRARVTPLTADRRRTTALVAAYRRLAASETTEQPAQAVTAQAALVAALGRLPGIRAAVSTASTAPRPTSQGTSGSRSTWTPPRRSCCATRGRRTRSSACSSPW
jgi:hypothetical protein